MRQLRKRAKTKRTGPMPEQETSETTLTPRVPLTFDEETFLDRLLSVVSH